MRNYLHPTLLSIMVNFIGCIIISIGYNIGQPIGIIVAEDEWTAKEAAKLVKVEYQELKGIY
jgi:hypothetical protein